MGNKRSRQWFQIFIIDEAEAEMTERRCPVIVEVVCDIAHVTAPFTLKLIGGGSVRHGVVQLFFICVGGGKRPVSGRPRGMPAAWAIKIPQNRLRTHC
eukprot:scaffold667_cov103-Skeletonema_dohrnii-CCMP3373.AAC.2